MTEQYLHSWKAAGLQAAGEGKILLSGPSEELFHAWEAYLRAALRPFYTERHRSPALIDRDVLDAAHYLEHFPQNVIHGRSHTENGRSPLCLSPAACLHLYPLLTHRPIATEGFAAMVMGPCARYESGAWSPPFRLGCFHMLEVVAVGPRPYVARQRTELLTAIEAMFAGLGIQGRFEAAEDAFFQDGSRAARVLQKLKGLKQEFRAPFGSASVALASINDHEDYFGRCFDIRLPSGAPAASLCAAFGIERLTAMGLHTWGSSPANWPEGLRQ